MPEDSPFIFISYSRQDQVYVSKLVQKLRERGFSVWLDKDTDYGKKWESVIQEKLETCQVFLLVMSPHSEKSYWVKEELNHIRKLEKSNCILPLLLDGEVWFGLATIQAVVVKGGKLPPDSFFERVREYFPRLGEAQQNRPLVKRSILESIQDFSGSLFSGESLITHPSVLDEDLTSEKPGISYHKLRDLLKRGKWKKADQETADRMLEVAGRQSEGWLDVEALEKFPCKDLKIIDRLWVQASKGKFGFSVQKEIWQECGSPTEYNKDWEKFGDRVGWRTNEAWISYGQVTFGTTVPKGHLPAIGWPFGGSVVFLVVCWVEVFSRVETCEV